MYHEEMFLKDKYGCLNYRFYLSKKPNQPLLVLLHGHGERGNDNLMNLKNFESLFKRLFKQEIIPNILVPQCPDTCLWSPLATYNIEDRTYDITKEEMSEGMKDLNVLVPMFINKNPNINKHKIILIGMSMGGAAVLEFAVRNPTLISDIYACCPASIPLKNAPKLSKINVNLYHGLSDSVIDFNYSIIFDKEIKKSMGNSNIILYDSIDHNCWDLTFENIDLNNLINH